MINFNSLIQTKIILRFLSVALIITFSLLYGFQIVTEVGTDYGIYYVGALSTSPSYPLYQGFFENKGPLFYGFIKALGFLTPYSLTGAALTLSLVVLLWLISVIISARILKLTFKYEIIALLMGISALVSQPTNAGMNIFMCSFYTLSLALAIRYRENNASIYFFGSVFASLCASLVKLDGFGIFFIVLVILCYKNLATFFRNLTSNIILLVLCSSFLILLLQKLLFFAMNDYWKFSFISVFTKVWNPSTSGGVKNIFIRD